MEIFGSFDTLTKEMLDTTDAALQVTLDRAMRASKREVGNAQEKADKECQKAFSIVQEEMQRTQLMEESHIRAETRKKVAAIKEDRIEAIFTYALKQLSKQKNGDYPAIITALITEAIDSLDGDAFVVAFCETDSAHLPDCTTLQKCVSEKTGRPIRLSAATSPLVAAGGVRITAEGGRAIYDNTYNARLDRQRETLRIKVAETLGFI